MNATSGPVSAGMTIEAKSTVVEQEHDMQNLIRRFAKDESGATAIEYGLIAALISVVIIGVLSTIGTNLSAKFNEISTQLD
jgi:pilus assembly protein Flp/PilA